MNFEEVDKIGSRIKEIRKQKNITIQKLSQFTDLSVGYLSNLERNQASPTLNNLQKICVALDISVRDLLTPRGEEKILLRWDDLKTFEYDEYKLKIHRMDFGRKRGVYEYSVYEAGKDKVTYVEMTADKAKKVIEEHLKGGKIVTEYTIAASKA